MTFLLLEDYGTEPWFRKLPRALGSGEHLFLTQASKNRDPERDLEESKGAQGPFLALLWLALAV